VTALVLVNPRSGNGGVDDLLEAARRRGLATHVLGAGDDPAEVARRSGADALGMAGGDGSLAPVAAVAIERDVPFVCIPFGTRNHFAQDLGLDRDDPVGALAAFEGTERRVDVGRVNERVFLNNVSLGVYARLVHRREHHRRRRNAFARLRALAIVAQHPRPDSVRVDGTQVEARVVLVANNAYELSWLSLGTRERLDEGRLHLYTSSPLRSDWEERSGERFTIDAGHRVRAAIDGEPALVEGPLEVRSEPRALRVLLPRGPLG
jgi:diacylglycerol kinase family enzyme